MKIVEEILKTRLPKTNLLVLDAIKNRFSPRVFSSDSIPQENIEIILEAARHAPSGRNYQPWFFYYVKQGTKEYEKLFTCIPERNFWAKTAPVIIVACCDPTDPKEVKNRWALYDLGASVMSLILEATELKYSCRQIGSFDWGKTKQEFSIPDPYEPFTLIAIGKMGTEDDYQKADKEIVEKELVPNPKKTKISENLKIREEN